MYTGQALTRGEDLRFLTGGGEYTADLHLPGLAYAAFLRSSHAHARIVSLAIESARHARGVLCVLTAKEWDANGLGRLLPPVSSVDFSDGRPMNEVPKPIFASGKVCHVGDTLAAVIAETPEEALEAVEAIEIEYEELPSITDVAQAIAPDGPLVHAALGTNIVFEVEHGDAAAVA